MSKKPDEMTCLRRLVKAQDRMLMAYRLGGRTPSAAIDEATRCRRWLEQYEQERESG